MIFSPSWRHGWRQKRKQPFVLFSLSHTHSYCCSCKGQLVCGVQNGRSNVVRATYGASSLFSLLFSPTAITRMCNRKKRPLRPIQIKRNASHAETWLAMVQTEGRTEQKKKGALTTNLVCLLACLSACLSVRLSLVSLFSFPPSSFLCVLCVLHERLGLGDRGC